MKKEPSKLKQFKYLIPPPLAPEPWAGYMFPPSPYPGCFTKDDARQVKVNKKYVY